MVQNSANNPIPKYQGVIAVIDMLGFREFVESNPLDTVIDKYARILTGPSHSAEIMNENLEFMVYSDTIAIRLVNHNERGFYNFIQVLHSVCRSYFYICQIPGENSLPVRGGIAFGEYSWHNGDITTQSFNRKPIIARSVNFIVGQAVLDAHELEAQQQWIGISMNKKTAAILKNMFPNAFGGLVKDNYLIEYDIPLKETSEKSYAINPIERSHFERSFAAYLEICSNLFCNNKIKKKVKLKYYNTLKFLIYLHEKDNICPSFINMPREFRESLKADINKDEYQKVMQIFEDRNRG